MPDMGWTEYASSSEQAAYHDFLAQMIEDLDFLATEFPNVQVEAIVLRNKVLVEKNSLFPPQNYGEEG